jgi:tetratricopeptide (TPR) repeat protein
MEKRWSKTEVAYLKRHAGSGSLAELARRLHTDAGTVRRKLVELNLLSEGSGGDGGGAALEDYAEALRLLHDQKWAEAAERLEKIAGAADSPHVADRARQNLAVCRQRLAEPPPAEDRYLQAVFEKNRGNLEAALELLPAGAVKKEERYAYLAASIQALTGAEEEALSHLATAIRLEPKNRIHAYHDPDFRALRGQKEFASLVAGD